MTASVEIERKFLVIGKPDRSPDKVHKIRQGYIARENGNTVRIREKDGIFILTIKTMRSGIGRNEIELEVSPEEGEILFASISHSPIEKIREVYREGNVTWEMDIFGGENKGLVVAEVELQSETQQIRLPGWIGPEVTGLSKYFNAQLATTPFSAWRISYQALIERMSGD